MSTTSDDPVDIFVGMSAALTGFQSSVLRPDLDPIGLSTTYYNFVNSRFPGLLSELLGMYQVNAGKPAQEIADLLLETKAISPSAMAKLAQSIVRMWYLGSWYTMGTADQEQVISQQAYIGGLTWKAMQSHPMGYSEFTFGYWSSAPPPLADFGVAVPSKGANDE